MKASSSTGLGQTCPVSWGSGSESHTNTVSEVPVVKLLKQIVKMNGASRPSERPMSPSRIASPARLLGLSPVKAPMMHSEGNPYLSAVDVHSGLSSNVRVWDNDDNFF